MRVLLPHLALRLTAVFAGLLCLQADDLDRQYARLRQLPLATLRKQALAGDPWAQTYLGIRRRDGDGIEAGLDAAIGFFKNAAAEGNVGAEVELGAAYLEGRGVTKDAGEAERRLRPLAERKVARAQFLMSKLTSGEESGEWVAKAAAQGHLPALRPMGEAELARLPAPDQPKAADWFRAAAKAGDALAARRLAELIEQGYPGQPADPVEARIWFTQASEGGDIVARGRLASYGEGPGPEKDEAVSSVAPARPISPSPALKPAIPTVTPVPRVPVGVDPLGAVSLEQRWQDFGDLMSSGAVSVLTAKGRLSEDRGLLADALVQYAQVPPGVSPSMKEQFAASVFASSRIIAIYASGQLSREQLETIRVRLPEIPSLVLSPVSRTQLGDLYWEGKVVSRDEDRALEWYLRAAQSGGPVAMARLAEIWRQGVAGQKPDRAEAVRWFRRAALLGHAVSQLELGRAYLDGDGVEKNARLAAKWLHRAARQKLPEAALLLTKVEASLTPEERARVRPPATP